eukprot:756555-Alexandrium_andersonii.AAC.1
MRGNEHERKAVVLRDDEGQVDYEATGTNGLEAKDIRHMNGGECVVGELGDGCEKAPGEVVQSLHNCIGMFQLPVEDEHA